jgi:hypothetical protein
MLRDALNPQLQACELVAGLLPERPKSHPAAWNNL